MVQRREDVRSVTPLTKEGNCNVVEMRLGDGVAFDFERLTRYVFASSSCGLCGKATIESVRQQFPPVESDLVVDAETLLALPRLSRDAQAAFERSGGENPRVATCIRVVLLVAAFTLTAAGACREHPSEPERSDFLIKVGTMERARPGVDRLHETRTVTMDPARRPGWCFLVDPPDDQPYEVYSVTHLPDQPDHLTGDFVGQSHTAAGLKSAPSRTDGIRPFCFDFDPGDPVGEYRVEVFINGVRHTEILMQVVQ